MHIDRVADLRQLLGEPRGPLTLDLQELGASREEVERRIQSDYNECGCAAGTVGMLGGLAVSLVLVLPLAVPWWGKCAAVLFCAVAVFGLGKWIGQSSARRRLRQTIEIVSLAATG